MRKWECVSGVQMSDAEGNDLAKPTTGGFVIHNVLNLGAGWQSSMILLMACRGILPKFDAAIFADTQWEPAAVYTHLEWLKQQAIAAGIPLITVTAGDLRADAIEFRRNRRSSDGKRFASIPLFVLNADGSQGRVQRQCTKEYKIEACEKWVRRELLGLKARQRVPKGIMVRRWFGISTDESGRAVFPGRWEKATKKVRNLFGELVEIEVPKKWHPTWWQENVYPLMDEVRTADRKVKPAGYLPCTFDRIAVGEWLRKNYPDRDIPRSACIGCPYRSNDEWRDMRDNRPDEWADACNVDDEFRVADAESQSTRRKGIVGTLFVHRQMVPLRMANLDGDGERQGGGCGTLFDGMDGLCGV